VGAHNDTRTYPISSKAFNIDGLRESQDRSRSSVLANLNQIRNSPQALATLLTSTQPAVDDCLRPFRVGLDTGRFRPLNNSEDNYNHLQTFRVAEAEPDLELTAIWGAAIMGLQTNSIFETSKKGDPIEFRFLVVNEFTSRISTAVPKYAMNIPIPDVRSPTA
jgi:hypothetical protein